MANNMFQMEIKARKDYKSCKIAQRHIYMKVNRLISNRCWVRMLGMNEASLNGSAVRKTNTSLYKRYYDMGSGTNGKTPLSKQLICKYRNSIYNILLLMCPTYLEHHQL